MEASKVLSKISIAQFYADKNIFVTGATGFMGKCLVESLLRKCDGIKCIYILVRMKRGVDPFERYQNYVQDIVFDLIRQEKPEQLKKIKLIKGDMIEENLGIAEKDELELIENVNIIFHCAARAKFSLTLRDALFFNTHGTLRVLQLAEKMTNLIVFSHFSTTYCNPDEKVLGECYQQCNEDPYEIIKLLHSPRKEDLDEIEPRLLKGKPNTYCVSKLLSEELVHRYREKIPFVVTRPSVVMSAWREPYPGYVENKKNGMIGPMMARGSGALRTILTKPSKLLELVPVDIATHAIIALTCKRGLLNTNDILYCNIIDSYTKPWNFGEYFDFEMEVLRAYPMRNQLWYPWCVTTNSKLYYNYRRLCYHYIPSMIGDIFTIIFRRKPQLVFFQKKFDRGMNTMGFYNLREYVYKNDQFLTLPNELSEKDRETFFCDFERLDMKDVFRNYVLGVRKYILNIKDEDSLEYRRGLITVYWYVDLLARIIFYVIVFIILFFVLFFIFDRDLLFSIINDIYNSAKFLISNSLVIKGDVLEKCNRP